MVNTITLRGHHIEALSERFAEIAPKKSPAQLKLEKIRRGYRSQYREEDYNKLVSKLERDKANNLFRKIHESFQRKKQFFDEIFEEILSNPNLQVNIVYGGDSICQECPDIGCSGRNKEVGYIDYEQDKSALVGYKINEDKTYTIGELIEIFRGYITKTGFPSPRTKSGFGRSIEDTVQA